MRHVVRARTWGQGGVMRVMVLGMGVGLGLASRGAEARAQDPVAVAWPAAEGGRPVAEILARATPADDSLRDETLARLGEYIRINTSNPPGNELAAAHWLKDVLAREGIESQILDTAELGAGRANFYAVLKGDGSQKGIVLLHHMDVVPAVRERWAEDPFAGVVKDGFLWGRGTLDMKGQGVIQLMALIALKRSGVHLTRDIVFIGNADEEEEGTGALAFAARHPDLLKNDRVPDHRKLAMSGSRTGACVGGPSGWVKSEPSGSGWSCMERHRTLRSRRATTLCLALRGPSSGWRPGTRRCTSHPSSIACSRCRRCTRPASIGNGYPMPPRPSARGEAAPGCSATSIATPCSATP